MYEIHEFEASELLGYLNTHRGEVIYLAELGQSMWRLVFKKITMGRPPKKAEESNKEIEKQFHPLNEISIDKAEEGPTGFPIHGLEQEEV